MRVLFTTIHGAGHFNPLVPIARAAASAGHEVAVACALSFVPAVERAGFTAFPAGLDLHDRTLPTLFAGVRTVPWFEAGPWIRRHIFTEVAAAAMAPEIIALATEWLPDVIVRDTAECGGCVAAEALGIPHASVRTSAGTASYMMRRDIAAELGALRARHGLPPDPDAAMLFRYLHFAAEPPGFLLAGDTPAPTAHLLRPVGYDPPDVEPPAWLAGLPDRPTIYATLGTGVSRQPLGHAIFAAILEALRDEPVNLVVTVGQSNDPARFGPQPDNVRIAQFIPQGLLLPHCDLVVNQGGFGTVVGALAAGLPQVIIPLGADQPQNAACCAALGAAIVLGPEERAPEAIRAAVRAALADPAHRRHAERTRDAMAALPGPERAVALLERLAAEKQPIPTER